MTELFYPIVNHGVPLTDLPANLWLTPLGGLGASFGVLGAISDGNRLFG